MHHGMGWGSWLLIVLFALLLIAFLPVWPYNVAWGVAPATGLGFLFLLFLVLLFVGAIAAAATPPSDRQV